MSKCHQNKFPLNSYDRPLKTFIRENRNEPILKQKNQKYKLKFQGTEARNAYTEITSLPSENKSLKINNTPEEIKTRPKKVEKASIQTSTTINTNTLFKAVESNDKNFVFTNFNSNNINISDQFGWSPLMSAAYSGHLEIVNYFLKIGANVSAQDKSGLTALDLALKKHHYEIAHVIKTFNQDTKDIHKKSMVLRSSKNCKKSSENKVLFCDTCKTHFVESLKCKHDSSIVHILNTEPKVKNTFYGIPRQSKGYQMLLNTGWDEEKGLGPSGEGKKYPVKTVLKRDRKGLGLTGKVTPRVTHFKPKDVEAVTYKYRSIKNNYCKKDREKQLKREIMLTRTLRKELS